MSQQNTMTFEEKVELFRQTANNPQLRAEFAASRAEVINPLLYHESSIRSIFNPSRVAGGATITYDVPFEDIEAVWVMPQIGGIPTVQVEGKQFSVDTFGLEGGIEYQQDIAADGRFDVAELATTLLKNKFIQQEELCGWNLIKAHAALLPNSQKIDASQAAFGNGSMTMDTFNEMITVADELGVGGRRVTDIYVSPRRHGDLRKALSAGLALPDSVKEQLFNGGEGATQVGGVRIHKVYNKALVDDTKAYAFTQKQGFRYGVMPIREELKTRDNPIAFLEWKIGIVGRERLGFAVLDDKGLIEVDFTA